MVVGHTATGVWLTVVCAAGHAVVMVVGGSRSYCHRCVVTGMCAAGHAVWATGLHAGQHGVITDCMKSFFECVNLHTIEISGLQGVGIGPLRDGWLYYWWQ